MSRAWSRLVWKLKYGWRRAALDRELEEEVRFHLDLIEQERRESGAAAGEAGRAARREFGNVGLVMEQSRTAWGWHWVQSCQQDLRFALRAFRRDWSSTTAAIIALALGAGLSIAIFTIVNAVLLQPLPYREPDRLVMVWAVNQQLAGIRRKYRRPKCWIGNARAYSRAWSVSCPT